MNEIETNVTETKKPLLKRELSFRRKPKAQELAPPPHQDPQPAAQDKEPARKRELSLRRRPKDAPAEAGAGRRGRRGGAKPHVVGLKIGASQIAAAEVVNNGHAEVVRLARRALEPGVVVAGVLREPEQLGAALAEFFEAHKLPRRGVRLGIANNRIGVRVFDVAGIDDPSQLGNAVRFKAQETLPIPIEDAVLDYRVLEERVDEEGMKIRRVLLVVAYRELIDRYLAACELAGIRLMGIDLEAFAILRALGPPSDAPASDAARVVVATGHDRSTFALSYGGVCEFTRVLDRGGSSLDVAVGRALDVSPAAAEPIKRALGLDGEGPVPGAEELTEEQIARVHAAAGQQVQSFARELVSSLQFYQKQPGSHGIGEVVLTGGTAGLRGFASELQRLIGVPVRVGDPLARVKVATTVADGDEVGSLAVAIGLGIEE